MNMPNSIWNLFTSIHTFHRCNIRSIHYFLQKTHLRSNKRFLLQVQYLLELSHMLYLCPLIQTGEGDDKEGGEGEVDH